MVLRRLRQIRSRPILKHLHRPLLPHRRQSLPLRRRSRLRPPRLDSRRLRFRPSSRHKFPTPVSELPLPTINPAFCLHSYKGVGADERGCRFNLVKYEEKLANIKWLGPQPDEITKETAVKRVVLGLLTPERRLQARREVEMGKGAE